MTAEKDGERFERMFDETCPHGGELSVRRTECFKCLCDEIHAAEKAAVEAEREAILNDARDRREALRDSTEEGIEHTLHELRCVIRYIQKRQRRERGKEEKT